jgi:hypothetical protein
MSKVVLGASMSLDGFIAGPNGRECLAVERGWVLGTEFATGW